MKKIILIAALAFGALFTANAQEQAQDYHSKFQVTLFPPVGTNGRLSSEYTNDVSLNLVVGVSKNETALALGGVANVVRQEANGVQAAGVFNAVGGNAVGGQIAGVVNAVGGEFSGIEVAGVANAAGESEGFQIAGVGNVVGEAKGLQLAGVFNFAKDDVEGVQIAGVLNKADNVLRGTQIGLVNIAYHNDVPIGLVNIIKNGEMGVAVTYNDLGSVSATFRSGGRVTYGILGLGYNTRLDGDDKAWTITGGIGAHINVAPWFRINNELTMETMDAFGHKDDDGGKEYNSTAFRTGYSLLPAFRLGNHFEIFGGPGIFYQQTKDAAVMDIFAENPMWDKADGYKLKQVVLGWQVGCQVVF